MPDTSATVSIFVVAVFALFAVVLAYGSWISPGKPFDTMK